MGRKTLTKEEAAKMANSRWSKLTKEDRSAHAVMMNKKRWEKKKLQVNQEINAKENN